MLDDLNPSHANFTNNDDLVLKLCLYNVLLYGLIECEVVVSYFKTSKCCKRERLTIDVGGSHLGENRFGTIIGI